MEQTLVNDRRSKMSIFPARLPNPAKATSLPGGLKEIKLKGWDPKSAVTLTRWSNKTALDGISAERMSKDADKLANMNSTYSHKQLRTPLSWDSRQNHELALPCLIRHENTVGLCIKYGCLTQSNAAIKVPSRAHKEQSCFAIITLIRLVHISVCHQQDLSSKRIPLQCGLVRLIKGLLTGRCAG